MLLRRAGRTPSTAVFGRVPRLNTQLLSDETSSLTIEARSQDEALQFSDTCRTEAIKAFADEEASASLRASILRKTRSPDPEPVPGMRVGVWRAQSRRNVNRQAGGKSTRAGYELAHMLVCNPMVQTFRLNGGDTYIWLRRKIVDWQ